MLTINTWCESEGRGSDIRLASLVLLTVVNLFPVVGFHLLQDVHVFSSLIVLGSWQVVSRVLNFWDFRSTQAAWVALGPLTPMGHLAFYERKVKVG